MARMVLLVLALLCPLTAGAQAQCCGDCNGDGTVSINELITAVNNALLGCGAFTPTPGRGTPTHKPTATATPVPHCALSFTDQNGVCDFNGPYNRGCGSAVNTVLLTNGSGQGCKGNQAAPPFVTVILATETQLQPFVSFSAHVESATSASLCAWSPDAFQTRTNLTAGVLQLNNGGTQLEIFPDSFIFQIQSCDFTQYLGAYTGNTITVPAQLSRTDGEAVSGLQLSHPIPNLGCP